MRNRGIEMNATWKAAINKDWNYSIGVNFTHNKNEIVSLKEEDGLTSFFANGVKPGSGLLFVMKSVTP
jgi:hypothetical protein